MMDAVSHSIPQASPLIKNPLQDSFAGKASQRLDKAIRSRYSYWHQRLAGKRYRPATYPEAVGAQKLEDNRNIYHILLKCILGTMYLTLL